MLTGRSKIPVCVASMMTWKDCFHARTNERYFYIVLSTKIEY